MKIYAVFDSYITAHFKKVVKKMEKQIRELIAYFELMAEIINSQNEWVGFCFVELLPGVRNPTKKISFRNLLKII